MAIDTRLMNELHAIATKNGKRISVTIWVGKNAAWPKKVDLDTIEPKEGTPLDREAIAQLRKLWEAATT